MQKEKPKIILSQDTKSTMYVPCEGSMRFFVETRENPYVLVTKLCDHRENYCYTRQMFLKFSTHIWKYFYWYKLTYKSQSINYCVTEVCSNWIISLVDAVNAQNNLFIVKLSIKLTFSVVEKIPYGRFWIGKWHSGGVLIKDISG